VAQALAAWEDGMGTHDPLPILRDPTE
jgi:hypothetical protein